MAQNSNWGFSAGGGGFLRILGIGYLIKMIRRCRDRRRLAARDSSMRQTPPTS